MVSQKANSQVMTVVFMTGTNACLFGFIIIIISVIPTTIIICVLFGCVNKIYPT